MTMFTSQLAGPRDEHDRLARETAFNNLAYAARMEMRRQHEKWGEQNHADGTGPESQPLVEFTDEASTADVLRDLAREACQANGTAEHPDTWTAILLEEVFEALAEDDPALLRAELVQVAAVALQWAGAIDRRPPLPQAAATSPAPIIAKPADEAAEDEIADETLDTDE